MTSDIPLDSINFEYKKCRQSNAETIVLVHGLGLDMTSWDDIVPLLEEKFHVLRYDLMGHGKSYCKNINEISWANQTAIFTKLLEELEINQVHIIGHSAGGNIGLELAKQLDIIQSLTLVSTPLFVPKDIGKEEVTNRFSKLKSNNMKDLVGPIIESICYPATNEKKQRLEEQYNKISIPNYSRYLELVSEKVLSYNPEQFQKNNVPMMILVGDHDPLYPPQLQVLNMGYLKNVGFYIVPDASNAIMMDQPGVFVQYIKFFIDKINRNAVKKKSRYLYSKPLDKELRQIFSKGMEQVDSQYVFKVNIIDDFKVTMDGLEVEGKWNQRKAKQLFTYLILHNKVTRENLIDTFWPDNDIQNARNHLRVSLNHIKNIIEGHTGKSMENYVSIDRDTIQVIAKVNTDLIELIKILEYVEEDRNNISVFLNFIESLPEILFPSYYDDWILNLRTKLESRIISICESLLDEKISDKQAIRILKVLIKYNPIENLYFDELISLLQKTSNEKEVEFYKNKQMEEFK